MTRSPHDEAQELIALGESLSDEQQSWLRTHVAECEACRNYAEVAGGVVRALRSVPITADSRLVRATQMRVRFHASRLRETRERMWFVGVACMLVGVSSALTAPLFWRLFEWMGEQAGVANPVWQAGFAFFCVAPALVVGALLLARGTHLRTDKERSHQWR